MEKVNVDANILMNTDYTNTINTANKKDKLIYPELSYKLSGICFNVHNKLGRFCRERQYCDELEAVLSQSNLSYKREFIVMNTGNILDFLLENKVIIEVKAKPTLTKEDYYQLQRYLQILNIKLGLLINFRNRYLKPLRVIKIDTDARKNFL